MPLPRLAVLLALLLGGASLALGAPSQRVVMQLDWIHNVQFAGLYVGVARGHFAAEGLELEIRPVVTDQATVEAVLGAGLALGSAESNVLLGARAKGAPVVAVATMFQDSPLGWMTLEDSGITSPADFPGRRIGVHPDGEKVIDLAVRRAGGDPAAVKRVKIGHDPSALLQGEVDAMQGYLIDEFIKLQLLTGGRGRAIPAREHGYAAYSQVVFTTEAVAREHPEIVRGFLRALQRGWRDALADPEAAADLVLRDYNPKLDRAYQVASLRSMEDLVSPGGLAPLSRMTLEKWSAGHALFRSVGLLAADVDLEPFVRFEFIPAAAP